jgi:hypothetical protein
MAAHIPGCRLFNAFKRFKYRLGAPKAAVAKCYFLYVHQNMYEGKICLVLPCKFKTSD